MALIHTSDWHLGKKLAHISRLPEQKKFLEWLLDLIIQKKIEALVIAGDIFDTPHPPNDALKVYFDFLEGLSQKSSCQVFIIAGNHDSGQFLEAPLPFLKKHQIQLLGNIKTEGCSKYHCQIDQKEVEITMLPFFRSRELSSLEISDQGNLEEKEIVLERLKSWVNEMKPSKEHSILVGHHNFGSFLESESEHSLSLSGLESLPLDLFKAWDYLALGHIHKPQKIRTKEPSAYYSGSPIEFRFSEVGPKFVNLLRFENELQIEKIEIPKSRKLIRVQTTEEHYEQDLQVELSKIKDQALPPLFEIKIHLKTLKPQILERIRESISHSGGELISYRPIIENLNQDSTLDKEEIQNLKLPALFKKYHEDKYPDATFESELKESFATFLEEFNSQSET